MNGRFIADHSLLYFDEIGLDYTSGLVCSGLASDVCCRDYDPLTAAGKNGSKPNGIGSWLYPDGSYVRLDCGDCTDAKSDPYLVHRTENSTILYRNELVSEYSSGIYRCQIPLNISTDEPLTQHVGIYKRRGGKTSGFTVIRFLGSVNFLVYYFADKRIGIENVQLNIAPTQPPIFSLHCITTGGPLSETYWEKDGVRIMSNSTFRISFIIEDYVNATYNHTLTVSGNHPGHYAFIAKNPFDSALLSGSKIVDENGMFEFLSKLRICSIKHE